MEGGATRVWGLESQVSDPHRSDVRAIFSNTMTLPQLACVTTIHGIEIKNYTKRDIYTTINTLLIQVPKIKFVVVENVN